MSKVTIIIELNDKYMEIQPQGGKAAVFKVSEPQLIVESLVEMAKAAPEVVEAEPIQMDAHRPPPSVAPPADLDGEDLMGALVGVMGDARVQQGAKSLWGFLQTLKTTPPPAKAEGEE